MSDTSREIDTERAGGTGAAAPKAVLGAPPMTYAEALEYHAKFDWRTIPGRSDRARQALIAEIERLRTGNEELERRESSAWRQAYQIATTEIERLRVAVSELEAGYQNSAELCLTYQGQRDQTAAELDKFRAALPGIIGCACGDGIECDRDPIGYGPCCATRLRMVKAGLIPAPERQDEQGDGA